MKKSTRKAIVVIIGIMAAIIIVSMIVIGFNCYKNRWHKIDFVVDSVNVTENTVIDDSIDDKYVVNVKGTARAWFYDFNTYEFLLGSAVGGEYVADNLETNGTLIVDNFGKTSFEITFTVDEIEDIRHYVFYGYDIIADGKASGVDIRLFMNDYADMIPEA